jgi:ribosomal protein L24
VQEDLEIGDLVHVTRGYYKGRTGRVISRSLNSVSIRTGQGVTTVTRGDIAMGSSPIPLPPVDNRYRFKAGDKVIINEPTSADNGETGVFVKTSESSENIAIVRIDKKDKTNVFYFDSIELAPKRVIGQAIAYEDIKENDIITSTTKKDEGGVKETVVRTGTVAVVGPLTVRTKEGSPINHSNKSTFVLDGIAPPVDTLLEALRGYPLGTVIKYNTGITLDWTGVKTGAGWIVTESRGNSQTLTTEKLRTVIGTRSIRKIN